MSPALLSRPRLATLLLLVVGLLGPALVKDLPAQDLPTRAAPAQDTPAFAALQPALFAAGGTLANAFADFDGDGDLDLFVGFNGAPNRLYRNTRGVFEDIASSAGLADARPTRAAAWGDFDADGDPDLLLGFTPGAGGVLRLYRNDGGRFTDVTRAAALAVDSGAVRQPVFVDFDSDGDLDLFVAFRDRPNMLYRNDAANDVTNTGSIFTEIAASVGLADPRKSVGAVWFDYQQDGDLDVYVANQEGGANGFFRNDGGRFTDIAEPTRLQWGGRRAGSPGEGTVRPCVADVNNDGVADLFAANYGANGLFLGAADGTFRDASSEWGVAIDGRYDTCAPADVDNDGDLDLYVNGTVSATESYRDFLFLQRERAFLDRTPPNVLALNASHGVQWADVDGDGALDLALAGSRADMPHTILRNLLPADRAANSLQVRVLNADGRAMHAGAEVRVYAAGTRRLLGMRWVDAGSGYDAQSDGPVHFGVPSDMRVDVEVTVPWGGSRVATMVRGVLPSEYAGKWFEVRAGMTR